MASTNPSGTGGRTTRRRSRHGCRNCKLRKLKCDESKPQCKRCRAFGLLCNYLPTVPDMQPVTNAVTRGARLSPHTMSSDGSVWTSDGEYHYHLNAKCKDFITRYLGRSLINPHDPNVAAMNRDLLALAFTHPFLMHASLAVSYAYDRHLYPPSSGRRAIEECYHYSEATALFNARLRSPIATHADMDAIWGTAAALAVLSFSNPSEESMLSWQSAEEDLGRLEWLRMSKGKMSLWRITNPLRADSLFRVMAGTYAQIFAPQPEVGCASIPIPLAALCGLHESSTAESNPYFDAAHALSLLWNVPDREVTVGHTEIFTRGLKGPFEALLKERDPRALLLLWLWYSKAGRCIWWAGLRAKVECPNIERYLRKYHRVDGGVMELLPGGAIADCWWHDDHERIGDDLGV